MFEANILGVVATHKDAKVASRIMLDIIACDGGTCECRNRI